MHNKFQMVSSFRLLFLIILCLGIKVSGQKNMLISYTANPPQIDGIFSAGEWDNIQPDSGFIQMEPDKGCDASEITKVYASFDSINIYVAFSCIQGSGTASAILTTSSLKDPARANHLGSGVRMILHRRGNAASSTSPRTGRRASQRASSHAGPTMAARRRATSHCRATAIRSGSGASESAGSPPEPLETRPRRVQRGK